MTQIEYTWFVKSAYVNMTLAPGSIFLKRGQLLKCRSLVTATKIITELRSSIASGRSLYFRRSYRVLYSYAVDVQQTAPTRKCAWKPSSGILYCRLALSVNIYKLFGIWPGFVLFKTCWSFMVRAHMYSELKQDNRGNNSQNDST